jgi:ribosomal protein L40E
MAQAWVIALVAIAIVHLVATVALYYWLGLHPAENDTTSDVATNTESADGDEVVCPNCGTRNAADYRYCRQCVSPLGPAQPRRSGEDADSPWIR